MVVKAVSVITQVIIFGTFVGGIVAITSVGFVSGVKQISLWRDNSSNCIVELGNSCFSIQPLLFLFASAILIILVKRNLNIQRYHGPADVILSAHSPSQDLDPKTSFLNFLCICFCKRWCFGRAVWPLVHLGGTIGNLINKRFPDLLTKDTFIGCGVAAAISLDSILQLGEFFAHEAILRHFSFKAIAPIAVAVSSALH